jgi:Ca2+-binding RTX toxin-like protein
MHFPNTRLTTAGMLLGTFAISTQAAHADQPVKVDVKHRTLEVRGTNGDDSLALRLGDPQTLVVDVGADGSPDFQIALGRFDSIEVDARGGSDAIQLSDNGGTFTTTVPTHVDGGSGDDTITGASGDEALTGGDGRDTIDGNRGADVVTLGAGDDRATWDPGDGSDVVDGDSGNDTLAFNGSNAGEEFDISADGGRVRFFRNVASITMDLGGIERIDTRALGGVDRFVIDDLSGTGVSAIGADLGSIGGTEDGSADEVDVIGTAAADTVTASGAADTVSVTGLPATVNISHAAGPQDLLGIFGTGGDDVIDGSRLSAEAIQLKADGGAGADVLLGGAGADTLLGGSGDDVLIGGPSFDTLDGGTGDNVLIQD